MDKAKVIDLQELKQVRSLYSFGCHPRDDVAASLKQEGDAIGETINVDTLLDLCIARRSYGKRLVVFELRSDRGERGARLPSAQSPGLSHLRG